MLIYVLQKTLVEPLFATYGASLSRSGISIEEIPGISGSQPQWPNGSRKYWDSLQNGFKIPRNYRDQCQSNKIWSLPTIFLFNAAPLFAQLYLRTSRVSSRPRPGFSKRNAIWPRASETPWWLHKSFDILCHLIKYFHENTNKLKRWEWRVAVCGSLPKVLEVLQAPWRTCFLDVFAGDWHRLPPSLRFWNLSGLQWLVGFLKFPEMVLAYASFRDIPLKAKYL